MKWKNVADYFWKIARSRNSTVEIAWGAAIGTFISVFPTFGFGTPIVLLLSRFFRFNLAIALAASVISNPFTSPFFMYLNYKVGAILLNNPIVFNVRNWKENLADTGLSILTGSFLVSGFMALLAYYFTEFMVERYRNRKKT